MKKFIAVILLVVSIVSCFVGCQTEESDAGASSGGQSQKEQETVLPTEEPFDILTVLEWEAVPGGIEITNYTGTEKVVQVPEVIEGKKVVSIGSAFSGNVMMEELILPESVGRIVDLRGCDSLKILRAPGVIDIKYSLPRTIEELYLPNIEYFHEENLELKKLELPKESSVVYRIKTDEVIISENLKYFDVEFNRSICLTCKGLLVDESRSGVLITDENAAEIYCYVFRNSKVIVNGVSYESNLDEASFQEKYYEVFAELFQIEQDLRIPKS